VSPVDVKSTYAADSEADSWDGQIYRQMYKRFQGSAARAAGCEAGLPWET